jgi:hypothetical protein
MNPNDRPYIIKANNAGLVTTTNPGPDLLHTLPVATVAAQTGARHAIITKIMAYNNTGGDVTLTFGTLNRAGAPAFVALMPAFVAIDTFDNEWEEKEIPAIEFISYPQLTSAGRIGDIYVSAGAAGVVIVLEVKEIGW